MLPRAARRRAGVPGALGLEMGGGTSARVTIWEHRWLFGIEHPRSGRNRVLWLGLRRAEVVLPVLLHALPFLRLIRTENRDDLGVVFVVNCP